MSVNMIHCCLQCSWVKDEQRPCIIQSDTVLRHIGQGNWSQSCLRGRAGQLLWETEAEAPLWHLLSTLVMTWTVSLQSSSSCDRGQSLNFPPQPIELLPRDILLAHGRSTSENMADVAAHMMPHDPTRHHLLSLWVCDEKISIPLTQADSFFYLGLI